MIAALGLALSCVILLVVTLLTRTNRLACLTHSASVALGLLASTSACGSPPRDPTAPSVSVAAADSAHGAPATASKAPPDLAPLRDALGAAEVTPSEAAWRTVADEADKCLAAAPSSAFCLSSGASARAALADDPGAQDLWVRALSASPSELTPYVALAELSLAWRVPSDALAVLEMALARAVVASEDRAKVHLLIARAHRQRGDSDQELQSLARAFHADTTPLAHYALGSALVRTGRSDDGARLLLTFIKRGCKGAAAHRLALECELSHATLARATASSGDVEVPEPPPAKTRATLPTLTRPPRVVPMRDGVHDVAGLLHDFGVPARRYVLQGEVTVVGVVSDTNFDAAPPCALHPTGKPHPKGCVAPLPSFRLADTAGGVSLEVLGFASNFATIHDARLHDRDAPSAAPLLDDRWSVPVPHPLPAPGARVRVTGRFGATFTKSSSGVVEVPEGVLTYVRLVAAPP